MGDQDPDEPKPVEPLHAARRRWNRLGLTVLHREEFTCRHKARGKGTAL
jgi:hypothetical protein